MAYTFTELNKASNPTYSANNLSFYELSSQPVVSIDYFTIEASGSFELVLRDGFDGTIEYSTDNGTTWNGPIDASMANYSIYGSKIMLRGTNNTTFYDSAEQRSVFYLNSSYDVTLSGDMETLLDYQTVLAGNHPIPANNCFMSVFDSWRVVDARNLKLLVNLSESCFSGAFANTSYLQYPPIFRANSVPTYAYNFMFGYSALSVLPKINATTYVQGSCRYMFRYCSNIKMSETQTGEYVNEYRIPFTGTGTTTGVWAGNMFQYTGGTYKGAPQINTTYYTSNTVV